MTREQYLENLILTKYKSVMSFAKYIEVPYTTVKGMLNRGVVGASVQLISKVCETLGITVDYLIEEKFNFEFQPDDTKIASSFEDEDATPVNLYERILKLTPENRAKLSELIDLYLNSQRNI